MTHPVFPADAAWVVLLGGAAIFEILSRDKLSHSTERFCKRRKLVGPTIIMATALHLSCLMPEQFDAYRIAAKMLNRLNLGCVL